jgi:hypothetical protein
MEDVLLKLQTSAWNRKQSKKVLVLSKTLKDELQFLLDEYKKAKTERKKAFLISQMDMFAPEIEKNMLELKAWQGKFNFQMREIEKELNEEPDDYNRGF